MLLLLPLLFFTAAAREQTLRSFVRRGSLAAEFKELAENVGRKYEAQREIQFDPLPPLEYERDFDPISTLNQPYRDILFEGDIRVSRQHLLGLIQDNQRRRHARQAKLDPSALWPDYIPYSFHRTGITSAKRAAIMRSIAFWQSETCIDFRPRTTEKHYLHFVGHDKGCWSTVGRDTDQRGQWISIGNGCEKFGISSHELGHALGLHHQQSRFDRDDHVTIVTSRIARPMLSNFVKNSEKNARYYGLPYDLGSVMHYGPMSFTQVRGQPTVLALNANHQQTMGSLEGPSFLDVQLLNIHYACDRKCSNQLACNNGGYTDPRNCYRCKCPSTYKGALCEEKDFGSEGGCGGELEATEEEKTLKQTLPAKRGSNGPRTCIYHVRAPIGKRLQFFLQSVNGTCEHGCSGGRVEFKVDEDPRPIGYRFCCASTTQRRFSSTSPSVPVILKADAGEASVTFTYKIEQDL